MVFTLNATPLTTLLAVYWVVPLLYTTVYGLTPAVVVNVNWVVPDAQTVAVGVDKAPWGEGFTVTVAVLVQPLILVYVIIVVPGATPVTKPVLLTVAILGFEEDHGVALDGVPDPVNCVVEPAEHTVNVPVIDATGFTVIIVDPVDGLLIAQLVAAASLIPTKL